MEHQQITVYATTTCPYCTMLANWLESKKVVFKKILVDQDREAAQHMIKLTGQMGVPVTEIEYKDKRVEFVIGFDQPQLSYLLGIK